MGDFLSALDQPHTQLLLRLVLGGVLLLAGITKLTDRPAFREAVAEYGVLPKPLETPFAAAVPVLEVGLGAFLLLGLGTAAAASIAVPLFLSFGVAIAANMARGRTFDCHCFGSVQRDDIGWPALLRAATLVTIALVVAVGATAFGALDAAVFGSEGLPPVSEIVPVVFMAAVVIDVLILLPETIAFRALFARPQPAHAGAGHHHGGHEA